MPVEMTVDGKRVKCRRIEVGYRKGDKTGKTTKVFCRMPLRYGRRIDKDAGS